MAEEVDGKLWGFPLKITGTNMMLLVLLGASVGFTFYVLDFQMKAEHTAIMDSISDQTAELVKQNRRQAEATEEQNYMLFYANDEEKEKIRKHMKVPEKFRELVR